MHGGGANRRRPIINKLFALLTACAAAVVAWCCTPPLSGSLETLAEAATPVGSASFSPMDPRPVLHGLNLRQEFALPPLHDGSGDQAAQIASVTQVFQRARLLNIDGGTAAAAWATAADTVTAAHGILPNLLQQPLRKLTFAGTQLSELSALIAAAGPAHISVISRTLHADTALTISGQNVILDFSGAAIEVGAAPPVWLIALVRARNVAVINAKINGGKNGFLVDDGSNIVIEANDVQGLTENGIVVTGSSSTLDIRANHLHDLGRAGVMLHGPVRTALVEINKIDHLRGHSNWHAGILLTGRDGDIAADPDTFFLPDHHWVVRTPIDQRLQNPSQNVVMGNTIREGLSSGIYNDGAIANIFLGNHIEGNSKEGICFDYGATANVFAGNLVVGNGNRWGQSDADLALDSVLTAGRAADGTSKAKLPGISIDNSLYNEIFGNDVNRNFGGGVKIVRTGLFNIIGRNALVNNNLGKSANAHFFGIELGAALADEPAKDLDFVASYGNIVFGNMIHGSHYAGIFFGYGSAQNDIFDNEIVGVEAFAVESEIR